MDYLIERQPQAISALGSSHIERGIENIAYLVMLFPDEFIAHFHFNWLAPVKIRRTMIAGSGKMILYDDIEPTEKVRVYDKGVIANRVSDREAATGGRVRRAALQADAGEQERKHGGR